MFFIKKLKDIVVDESDLCFIFDRHKSIVNGISKVRNHAYHRCCMRHLAENLRVNHQCGDSHYLYYNEAKSYSLQEFNNYFLEFKDKSPRLSLSMSMMLVLKNGTDHIYQATIMM